MTSPGDDEPDEQPDSGAAERPAASSPYATGGGGVTLERRVGALYLSRLLTGDTAPELGNDRRVVGVAFQQGTKNPIDDIVVHAATAEEHQPSLELAIAVRRRPNVVTSNSDMQKLVADLVAAVERTIDDDAHEHHVAIAVSGFQPHAVQLAQLAEYARKQRDAIEFFTLVEEPGRFEKALRDRLGHVEALVKLALGEAKLDEPDAAFVRRRTWQLLCRLHVLPRRVEEPETNDWADAQNRLMTVARGGGLAAAGRLLDRLESLAGQYAPSAATVDARLLRRAVHDLLEAGVTRSHRGWDYLDRLDGSAQDAVRAHVGAPGASETWQLDRGAQADDLLAQADDAGAVLVCGESGVGKSALALAAAERVRSIDRAGEPAEATCLNLRDLPGTWLELEQALGAPLGELLAQLSAPRRYLVVDAADAAAESGREMLLGYLVGAAISGDVHLIVVASDDGRPAVADVLESRLGDDVGHYEVAPLDDAALASLVAAFPRFERFAQSPRPREMLRRLVVVDLLVRGDVTEAPLSSAGAMRHIWAGLIRRKERRDRGLPGAREHVMLRLAAHELTGEPLEALDAEALDGLRRDAVLRHGQHQWQLAPQFAHDELRRYAVARLLLAENDVAAALMRAGAPRWALGAAALAVQLRLAGPAPPGLSPSGRLQALQSTFDALVEAGHGERWADLPSEALLTLDNPSALLADAWPALLAYDAAGLQRLLRVLRQRHTLSARLPDFLVAEPIVTLLLREERPWWIVEEAARLLHEWLLVLVMADTPEGHPMRAQLRDRLAEAVEQGEERLAQLRREADAARANPTAEQLDRARALVEHRRALGVPLGLGPPVQPKPELPGELTHETVVELLALLGPDLGEAGERLLRRLASDAPEALEPAVEQPGAGRALAAYGKGLLVDLAEAYYIDEDDALAIGIDEGVRNHRYVPGVPPSAYFRGPFLVLFQSDFHAGVAMLNRLLNHATRVRDRTVEGLFPDVAPDAARDDQHELDLAGQPATYRGDENIWRWYRGTSSGPYPCLSALQALEQVCDQLLTSDEIAVGDLVSLLLEDCANLAMPGLAVGMLVRHLERAADALDPYLAEPTIWHLETARVVLEQASPGLAADSTGLANAERRTWSFRETATVMTVHADEQRAEQLRAVGAKLVTRAEARSGGDDPEYVAMARVWASALDRSTYKISTENGDTYLQSAAPEDATATLAPGNADLHRGNDVVGLRFKYLTIGNPRFSPGAPPDGPELTADLERVRDLLLDPPTQSAAPVWGMAAAVASHAVCALAAGAIVLPERWRRFAVEIVIAVVERLGPADRQDFDQPSSEMDADRLVARALPAMLFARDTFRDEAGEDVRPRVIAAGHRLSQAAMETRMTLVSSLDDLWLLPCAHGGRCCHRDALDWTVEAMRDCVMGPWTEGRRTIERLGDPVADALATVCDRNILVGRLDASIRALSSAAASGSCVASDARTLLIEALSANRRATIAHKEHYDTYGTHARIAGRALLALAADGNSERLRLHLAAFASRPLDLAALLRGLTIFAGETQLAGDTARALWPQIMEQVLGDREAFADDLSGTSALAALLPRPGEPIDWTEPIAWQEQIGTLIEVATGRPRCIDAFIGMIAGLQLTEQATFGLPHLRTLVGQYPNVAQSLALDNWLLAIRAAALETEEADTWQHVVDALVVAGNTRLSKFSE